MSGETFVVNETHGVPSLLVFIKPAGLSKSTKAHVAGYGDKKMS